MSSFPKLQAYSAGWTDARFYCFSVGRRRAFRLMVWFGQRCKLPLIGRQVRLPEKVKEADVTCTADGPRFRFDGPRESLAWMLRVLQDQETCERRNKR